MAKKKKIFLLLLAAGLFLFSRLYNLTAFPIFCDEAIYIRWAQVLKSIHSLWWVPLSDGKQPLFMWLAAITLSIFSDPLFAGRLVSVLAGLGEAWLVWRLGRLLHLRRSWLAYFIYLLLPFFLFFNRLALVDSLLSFWITLSFYLAFLLAEKRKSWLAILLGISLGAAWLTKSPGEIFIFVVPLAGTLWLLLGQEIGEMRRRSFWLLEGLFALSSLIAFSLYNLLRLAPVFYMISRRNRDYLWGWQYLRQHPFGPLLAHLGDLGRYYLHYLTWPGALFALLGFLLLLKKKNWPVLAVLLLWWLPVIPMLAVAKVFTARYVLFSALPLLLSIGIAVDWLWRWQWGKGLILVAALPALVFMKNLWQVNPHLSLPRDEYRGYLEAWTAGEGIRPIARYLQNLPPQTKAVVGTEGFFGTLPNGLQIYFDQSPNITVIGVGVDIDKVSSSLLNAKKAGNRVFLVANASRFHLQNPQKKGLVLIKSFPKPGGDKLLFWELKNVQKM